MLGRIPQRAPLAKFCMISGSPLFSIYIQMRTKAPVRGMTPTRPAVDGSFFPIPVATRMIATLKTTFSNICINDSLIVQPLINRLTYIGKNDKLKVIYFFMDVDHKTFTGFFLVKFIDKV